MIEQDMAMSAASMFWMDALHDCHLDRSLPLPYDRHRASDEHRSGRGTSISFDFGHDLSHHFLLYASSNGITVEHLSLACCYAFLFKLCNGERDLCVGMNVDGRYKEELKSVIGMFVNTIPLRCQLDPHWSFDRFVKCVAEKTSESMRYSYYPIQCIFAQHPNMTKPGILDASFAVISSQDWHEKKKERVMIGDAQLDLVPISINTNDDTIMSTFGSGSAFTVAYHLGNDRLSCIIEASLDLFDMHTVDKIAHRFHSMLAQLFHGKEIERGTSTFELSLMSADEQLLIQSINNTQMVLSSSSSSSSSSTSCIHHLFVHQVMKHPQKLAVELDDQCLTYAELLFYSQLLSVHLIKEQKVRVGDIVCQCVERSLSMVSQSNNLLIERINCCFF